MHVMADMVVGPPYLAFSPGVFFSLDTLWLGLVLGDNEMQRRGWLDGYAVL